MKNNKILIGVVSFFIAGLGHFFLGKNLKGFILLVSHISASLAKTFVHDYFSMLLVGISIFAIYDCMNIINEQRSQKYSH